MNPTVNIYCRTFWWVYAKVCLYNFLYRNKPIVWIKPKLMTKSFKFMGKNYLWIYWIKIYMV